MQLIKIASIEGTTKTNGIKAREEALKEWLKSWVVELDNRQSAMTELVSAENQDAVIQYLSEGLTDKLIEEAITIEKQPTKIIAKVAAFRRRSRE